MILKIFVLVFALLSVLNCFVNGQRVDLPFKNFTSLSEALQDAEKFILKLNETYNMPSLTFGLSVKGKTVWKKAWGYAELENYVPARTTTRYRIASVSKTFTATLIGTLIDKGSIHLDDLVSKYLWESIFRKKIWDENAVNITIRQLLSHTAGLNPIYRFDLNEFEQPYDVSNMLKNYEVTTKLKFKPGSHFEYSNYGFQLLGAVIELYNERSGEPEPGPKTFQDIMGDFLHQIGLNSTFVGTTLTILHNSARYYQADVSNIKVNVPCIKDDLKMLKRFGPSVGIISNIEDLLHYGQLLIDAYKGKENPIISQKTLKQLWSSQAQNISMPFYLNFDYGFGWFVGSENAKLKHQHIVGHQGAIGRLTPWDAITGVYNGDLGGASSMLLIYPEEEIVGVALTNKGGVRELDELIVYTVENVYDLVK